MLQNLLENIIASLTDFRPKFLFGYFDNKEKETIRSYLKEGMALRFPDVTFLTPEEYRKTLVSASSKLCCIFLDEAFERRDIAPLINLAYGNKNLILVGFSSKDVDFLDPSVITTIAARYDSYFVAPSLPADVASNYVSFLIKGGLSLDKDAYVDDVLSKIIKEKKTRKKEAVRGLVEFLVNHAGDSFSARCLASSMNSFSPNALDKYLKEFCRHYLFYRLDGYDFSAKKVVGGNFRMIPYDTSLYSFSRREALKNIDLLSLTPLLGRAKEEAYNCYWGYFHRKKRQNGSSRSYRVEDVGLAVFSDRRKMIFVLDLSGTNEAVNYLSDVPQTIEKYRLISGNTPPYYDRDGVCHVGIVYLLGKEFDWRRR